MTPQITAALIVKNEESCLRSCLESIKDFDEIVVVDTGSTDKTVEIAKEYTKKIFHFPWVDDFSAARNFAKSKCTKDWILSIDADHQLLCDVATVRSECARLDTLKEITGLVKYRTHHSTLLFRNLPNIKWVGKVHEVIHPQATVKTKVEKNYDYSEAHKLDPDRNLRILKGIIDPTPRDLFYLGNEYFDRKDYENAEVSYLRYLRVGTWHPEVADAYLRLARVYWQTNRGEEAREYCLQAIGYNPDFKEALSLMSEMTYSPLKEKWKRLADTATNTDVLFVRI